MTLAALQGRTLTRLVADVRDLLGQGEASSSSLRALEAVRATGLWSERGEVTAASPALVALIDRLPSPGEATAVVFSLLPGMRESWLRVVRARLSELGERGDVANKKSRSVVVQGTTVTITGREEHEFISLTDMLRAKEGDFFISDWLRNRNTVEFLGVWERVHNPNFNYGEFATIGSQAGLNSYKLSVKEWVDKTGAMGLRASAGRYGGTYAHPDIAFEFAMWISPEFKAYLVQEFRRLKNEEAARESRERSFQRALAKVNDRIHTDASQELT
jgi:hypothetical protein